MAVFEWVRDKVALVVRAIVPIPMVVVHVRNGIDTAFMALDFRLGVDLAFGLRALTPMLMDALIGLSGSGLQAKVRSHSLRWS